MLGIGHPLTDQEERPVLSYKTSPGRTRIQISDEEMGLLGSYQTAGSLAAQQQLITKAGG